MAQKVPTVHQAFSGIMARLQRDKQRIAVLCSDDKAQLYYYQQFCREFESEIRGHQDVSMTARMLHDSREHNSIVTFFNAGNWRLVEGQEWSHVVLMLAERDLALLLTVQNLHLGLRLGEASIVEVEAR